MDAEVAFPFFLIAVVATFILALRALLVARSSRAQLAELTEKFYMFDHRLLRLGEQLAVLRGQAPDEAAAAAGVVAPAPPDAVAVVEEPPVPERPLIMAAEADPIEPARPPSAVPAAPAAVAAGPNWEQLLVENWLVWLGGAALALGGVFLVKLSIDYGLLTEEVRVVLAIALGIGLSVAAEWVRRRDPPQPGDQPGMASYVPQALAAAGAATVFAAVYAAYALYLLIPSGVAFVLLAATAGAAVAQSLRHGPLVAALGLVGAYVVPALVSSDSPHALPLFAYLAVVTSGALALLRHREWWWLAWFALGGALIWVPLWLGATPDPEGPVVAAYLLVLFGLFAAFRRGIAFVGFLAGVADSPMVQAATRTALWGIALALLVTAHADRFGMSSVAAGLAATIGFLALAYRDPQLDDAIAAAGALGLALLASWSLPLPTPEMNFWVFRLQPDHVADFTAAALIFAAVLGGGGFAALPKVPRPGRWAALSAAAPVAILIIAYWRLQKFELDIAWTLMALAVAGAELAAAAVVAKRRSGDFEIEVALASYAVGVLGGTITAAAFGLGEAWLTVALAVHLPAIGFVEGRVRVPALRWVAFGLAASVLVRLVLNPYVLDYPLGAMPIVNWILYGYGVPAAAFIVATRQFGSSKDDGLVWLLEAGSAVFLLLLLTLELIHAMYGRLTMGWVDHFGAGAALFALWLGFGAAMLALGEWRQRPVLRWGGIMLLAAVTVLDVLWQFVTLIFGTRVGNLPLLNDLLLAEAAPVAIYAFVAWLVPHRPVLRTIARVLAAVYGFAWVTLEIRHLFHDKIGLFGSSTEAEWYAYSVAWLAFAGAVLALGLIYRSEWLRRVGLIGVAFVIGKVFLSDMAELSGVLRALSFIGLGGALVGLGYAYRRLRPLQPQPADATAPQ